MGATNTANGESIKASYAFLKDHPNGKALKDALENKPIRVRFTEDDKVIAFRCWEDNDKNTRKAYNAFVQLVKKEPAYGSISAMLGRITNGTYQLIKDADGHYQLIGGPNSKVKRSEEVLKKSIEALDLHTEIFRTLYENNKKKTEDAILIVLQKEATLENRISLIAKLLKANKALVADVVKQILAST